MARRTKSDVEWQLKLLNGKLEEFGIKEKAFVNSSCGYKNIYFECPNPSTGVRDVRNGMSLSEVYECLYVANWFLDEVLRNKKQ